MDRRDEAIFGALEKMTERFAEISTSLRTMSDKIDAVAQRVDALEVRRLPLESPLTSAGLVSALLAPAPANRTNQSTVGGVRKSSLKKICNSSPLAMMMRDHDVKFPFSSPKLKKIADGSALCTPLEISEEDTKVRSRVVADMMNTDGSKRVRFEEIVVEHVIRCDDRHAFEAVLEQDE
jgi:hypothetical protein